MGNLYGDINMDQVMYGMWARRVPAFMVVQRSDASITSFIGGTQMPVETLWGSPWTHQLMVGELILRPHFVIATNDLGGSGLTSFLTDPFKPEWAEGLVVADPMGRARAFQENLR